MHIILYYTVSYYIILYYIILYLFVLYKCNFCVFQTFVLLNTITYWFSKKTFWLARS